jgi:4-(gamma-glutamylamino)butanal dehydrogenase
MTALAPPADRRDWERLARSVPLPADAFVDGAWRSTLPVVSPRDGAVVGEVASCSPADVDAAVLGARAAFEDGRWSRAAPAERKRVLLRLAELVARDRAVLALHDTLDMGKPITDGYAGDVPGSAACIAWYGEAADKLYDRSPRAHPSALALVTHEPVGVVGAVVPWNFPLLMAVWKLAPALAAGNSVVLKPAEQSPHSALHLAALAAEAGLPDGVLQVVPGVGETAGRALGLHPDVDVVAFTGSTEVGRHFLRYAADSNLKRVYLECGGKAPNIVLADADVAAAARTAAWGIFFNSGEMCTAASRLLVHRDVHDEVLDGVLAAAGDVVAGDPLDPATTFGPLVDAAQAARVRGYIARGVEEGARLATGGPDSALGGCHVPPTVFEGVRSDMAIAQEEIFGPVLATIPFRDVDEAIRIANDTPYGLSAAVWTRDLVTAHRTARRVRAGTVWVNSYEASDMTVPFGGWKQSGFGADKGMEALDKYMATKTTWIDLGS